jgi:hypothetical protein
MSRLRRAALVVGLLASVAVLEAGPQNAIDQGAAAFCGALA